MNKVLVIMPTYHGPLNWIKRAVESLKNQSFCDFDCWIVKDGCEENKKLKECKDCEERSEYMDELSKKDNRFKCYKLLTNYKGCGWGPRNFALLNTKHDFIAYLDDDNWYEPNHIDLLYKCIVEKNVDFAFTGSFLHNEDGKNIGKRLHTEAPVFSKIDTSEIMHRRHLVEIYGGWQNVPHMGNACDWDLVSRWMKNKRSWAHTGTCTANYMYRKEGVGQPRRGEKKRRENLIRHLAK